MKNKKLIIMGVAVVALLLAAVIGYSLYRQHMDEQYTKKQCLAIYDTVINLSAEIGISDIEIISIGTTVDENGEEYGWYTTYIKSEMFSKLNDEQKLAYFSRLAYLADTAVSPYIGCTHNKYGGLRILSDGHEYMYYSDVGSYTLYKDGEKIFVDKWGNNSWDLDAFEDFYEEHAQKPSGNCIICGETATDVFQWSNYCNDHYFDAVKWAFENVAGKSD